MGKRIQMRKNRIMTIQRMAEQRKAATLELSHQAQDHPDHAPKPTVSIYIHKYYHNYYYHACPVPCWALP